MTKDGYGKNGVSSTSGRLRVPLMAGVALTAVLGLAGCGATGAASGNAGTFAGIAETTQHGYVVSPMALEQVPPGSSKEQVFIALGSPSTSANYGNDVFYYISQTRQRPVAFMPEKVIDQRVVAVYFNDKDQVDRVANYGLKDGKVFDFITRTTPTGGADQSFLQQVLSGVIGFGKPGL
jgi:outer membrane protein assembly factor BamE (lipoprotein component of BamABCDE complex)